MIEKNEDNTENDNNHDRIKLIQADKRTLLEKQFLQVLFSIFIAFLCNYPVLIEYKF